MIKYADCFNCHFYDRKDNDKLFLYSEIICMHVLGGTVGPAIHEKLGIKLDKFPDRPKLNIDKNWQYFVENCPLEGKNETRD
jgi:hypothetical protein